MRHLLLCRRLLGRSENSNNKGDGPALTGLLREHTANEMASLVDPDQQTQQERPFRSLNVDANDRAKDNCDSPAMVERFFKTIKSEPIWLTDW